MDDNTFERFVELRTSFRNQVDVWSHSLPGLREAQHSLAAETGDASHPLETPVVYNKALDDIGRDSHIAWIVVADNPGKNEQLACSNRYLVGRPGITTERFFARELGVNLRREVVIINKTPIQSPKTAGGEPGSDRAQDRSRSSQPVVDVESGTVNRRPKPDGTFTVQAASQPGILLCSRGGIWRGAWNTQQVEGFDKLPSIEQTADLEYKCSVDAWQTGGVFWKNHAISHI
ncbi:MAG: hypothetical protein ABIJ86_16490 [Spirochaetota bacterium]